MATNIMTIPITELAKTVVMTVNISGVKSWRVRLKIGMWLVAIGCRIIGCQMKVE